MREHICEADGEAVLGQLQTLFSGGHLTMDDLARRIEQVLTARTRAELQAALSDLPT